jgi:hypothetical protein
MVARLIASRRPRCPRRLRAAARRGAVSSLDYVLVLGVILPLVAVVLTIAPQMIGSAFEMVCVLISWPFM